MKDPNKGRHRPEGLFIVYEDSAVLVVEKAAGLLTIGTDKDKTRTAYFRLTDYVRKGNMKSRNRIFIVHRLDRETSGLLVVAKTPEAKGFLQDHWDETEKKYYAVARGTLRHTEGNFTSYLTENTALVVHSVADARRGKLSRTDYRVIRENGTYSLLDLTLLTGRKHQIRVQLADAGHPLVGDTKYGLAKDPNKRLALHAYSLSFEHPVTRQRMEFHTKMPTHFDQLMGKS